MASFHVGRGRVLLFALATSVLLGAACGDPECASLLAQFCGGSRVVVYLSQSAAQGVRVDLDGDGVDELALVSREGEHLVLVFESGRVEMLGDLGDPQLVARAELDGDGLQDLVLATADPRQLLLLRSLGDGTLDRLRAIELDAWAYGLTAADLDGDGLSEVIVADGEQVRIFDAAGGQKGVYAAGDTPAGLSVGDLDGDGALDLVVVDLEHGELTPLIGDGAGGFSPGSSVVLEANAYDLDLADVDGDGALDALVRDRLGAEVWLAKGDGAGSFVAGERLASEAEITGVPGLIASSQGPSGLFAVSVPDGDLRTRIYDGDRQEVARSEWMGGLLGDFPGRLSYVSDELIAGEGFASAIAMERGPQPVLVGAIQTAEALEGDAARRLAVGDFDGDTRLDLAVTTERCGVFVLLGDGTGELSGPWSPAGSLDTCDDILAVDVNGDARDELLGFSYWASPPETQPGMQVAYRDAAGVFEARPLVLENGVFGVRVLESAGSPALVGRLGEDKLALVVVDGAGDLEASGPITVDETLLRQVSVADVDGDGRDELLLASGWGDRVAIYQPQGGSLVNTVSHGLHGVVPALSRVEVDIAFADLNADGAAEAVLVADEHVVVLGALGDPTPSVLSVTETSGIRNAWPRRAIFGDVDGDGDIDLSWVEGHGLLTVLHGEAGRFVDHALRVPLGYNEGVLAGQLDDKGRLDLLTIVDGELRRFEARDVTLPRVIRPIGLPNLQRYQASPEGLSVRGDIDGDGRTDILRTDGDSEYIAWGDGGRFARITARRGASLFYPVDQHLADLDGDGKDELLSVGVGGGITVVRKWDGLGWSLEPAITSTDFETRGRAQALASGDLDGDGSTDVALAWGYSEDDLTLGVWIAYADPTAEENDPPIRSTHTPFEVVHSAAYTGPRPAPREDAEELAPYEAGVAPQLQLADLDGDALAEVIVDGGYLGGVWILWNEGERRFSPQLLEATSARIIGPGVLVLTADDVLWRVPVYGRRLGNRARVLATEARLSAVTECNGDGLPDLLLGPQRASILLGVSSSFVLARRVDPSTFCDDVDGDGTPDIVSTRDSLITVQGSGGAL